VVGGGNMVREPGQQKDDRVSAEYMGMLATSTLALQDVLERLAGDQVMTAVRMESVAEPYIRRRAIRHLERARYLRRRPESILLHRHRRRPPRARDRGRGDPQGHQRRRHLHRRSPHGPSGSSRTHLQEAIVKGYAVMDANAFGLCKANQLPIQVFNINEPGAIARILRGERVGTLVR
jgi:uridylate kinase